MATEQAKGGLAMEEQREAGVRGARLSVLVPAYNERETIVEALRRVRAAGEEAGIILEIIVVDDASTDGTADLLAAETGIRVLTQPKNMGKGAGIRAALQQVTGDLVIVQDADLEYDPRDYAALIAPILQGQARVVYGSRFLRGRPLNMMPANYLCNRLLALATNLLFGARITDEATCYKAFDAGLLREIPLTCTRFEFCPEVTAKVLRRGERILEVPIHYKGRPTDAGKKIRWWDAIEAFWTLLKYRFLR
jgi:glycosyltransferase involved in cell wall biosynthesis